MPEAEDQEDDDQAVEATQDHPQDDQSRQHPPHRAVASEDSQAHARHDGPVMSIEGRASLSGRQAGATGEAGFPVSGAPAGRTRCPENRNGLGVEPDVFGSARFRAGAQARRRVKQSLQ